MSGNWCVYLKGLIGLQWGNVSFHLCTPHRTWLFTSLGATRLYSSSFPSVLLLPLLVLCSLTLSVFMPSTWLSVFLHVHCAPFPFPPRRRNEVVLSSGEQNVSDVSASVSLFVRKLSIRVFLEALLLPKLAWGISLCLGILHQAQHVQQETKA